MNGLLPKISPVSGLRSGALGRNVSSDRIDERHQQVEAGGPQPLGLELQLLGVRHVVDGGVRRTLGRVPLAQPSVRGTAR